LGKVLIDFKIEMKSEKQFFEGDQAEKRLRCLTVSFDVARLFAVNWQRRNCRRRLMFSGREFALIAACRSEQSESFNFTGSIFSERQIR